MYLQHKRNSFFCAELEVKSCVFIYTVRVCSICVWGGRNGEFSLVPVHFIRWVCITFYDLRTSFVAMNSQFLFQNSKFSKTVLLKIQVFSDITLWSQNNFPEYLKHYTICLKLTWIWVLAAFEIGSPLESLTVSLHTGTSINKDVHWVRFWKRNYGHVSAIYV